MRFVRRLTARFASVVNKRPRRRYRLLDPNPPLAFPRGRGSLPILFPPTFTTPEHKLVYALWKEGPQPYTNLPFLTGLPLAEIRSAVQKLEYQKRIERYPTEGRKRYDVPLFSLTRSVAPAVPVEVTGEHEQFTAPPGANCYVATLYGTHRVWLRSRFYFHYCHLFCDECQHANHRCPVA